MFTSLGDLVPKIEVVKPTKRRICEADEMLWNSHSGGWKVGVFLNFCSHSEANARGHPQPLQNALLSVGVYHSCLVASWLMYEAYSRSVKSTCEKTTTATQKPLPLSLGLQ